jgi:hypothetical protein
LSRYSTPRCSTYLLVTLFKEDLFSDWSSTTGSSHCRTLAILESKVNGDTREPYLRNSRSRHRKPEQSSWSAGKKKSRSSAGDQLELELGMFMYIDALRWMAMRWQIFCLSYFINGSQYTVRSWTAV